MHTNDLHAKLDRMPHLATVIKQLRAAYPDLILVDAGDWLKGHPLNDHHEGRPMVEIFNHLAYDAVGLGEDDRAWPERLKECRFPWVCCNAVFPGVQPFTVVRSIGIAGVTCGQAGDPADALRRLLPAMRLGGAKRLVVLSHLGLEADRALAAACPDIDLIVGGHSHVRLETPEVVGRVAIVQAGCDAHDVGQVTLQE